METLQSLILNKTFEKLIILLKVNESLKNSLAHGFQGPCFLFLHLQAQVSSEPCVWVAGTNPNSVNL